MLTKIMKWVSVAALLLALLWPSSAGYPMLLVGICGLCVSTLAAQASRAGKLLGKAGYTMVSREVKYEN